MLRIQSISTLPPLTSEIKSRSESYLKSYRHLEEERVQAEERRLRALAVLELHRSPSISSPGYSNVIGSRQSPRPGNERFVRSLPTGGLGGGPRSQGVSPVVAAVAAAAAEIPRETADTTSVSVEKLQEVEEALGLDETKVRPCFLYRECFTGSAYCFQ